MLQSRAHNHSHIDAYCNATRVGETGLRWWLDRCLVVVVVVARVRCWLDRCLVHFSGPTCSGSVVCVIIHTGPTLYHRVRKRF